MSLRSLGRFLFPEKIYVARIDPAAGDPWERLRANTEVQDALVSVPTRKTFVGRVRPGGFKLISAEIGRGAFCTLEGSFTAPDGSGTITVRVHKAFRVIILILMLLPVVTIPWTAYLNGWGTALLQLPIALVGVVMIRLVMIQPVLRSVSKSALLDLTMLLGLMDLREVAEQGRRSDP